MSSKLTVGPRQLQEVIQLESQQSIDERRARAAGCAASRRLTQIQPHSRLVLPLLANSNVQRRVTSQAIPNVGVAAVVVEQVLQNVRGSVHDAEMSARPGQAKLTRSEELCTGQYFQKTPTGRCNSPVLPSLSASALFRSLHNEPVRMWS